MRKRRWRGIVIFIIIIVILIAAIFLYKNRKGRSYTAAELGITELKSSTDYDGDGLDDYTDIMLGARAYIDTEPKYKSVYYEGGYPTDDYGVCTDVI